MTWVSNVSSSCSTLRLIGKNEPHWLPTSLPLKKSHLGIINTPPRTISRQRSTRIVYLPVSTSITQRRLRWFRSGKKAPSSFTVSGSSCEPMAYPPSTEMSYRMAGVLHRLSLTPKCTRLSRPYVILVDTDRVISTNHLNKHTTCNLTSPGERPCRLGGSGIIRHNVFCAKMPPSRIWLITTHYPFVGRCLRLAPPTASPNVFERLYRTTPKGLVLVRMAIVPYTIRVIITHCIARRNVLNDWVWVLYWCVYLMRS